ncbi:hypothetical protein GJU39_14185 [Pedobacter petrophilus]|uniref:Uncharacterized protein n=1 Tax=Pedobacter petrophilus TaxID=1908241 RepID=A0A7K0G1J9_9SPHI|nr:hypothetical protein [Pedobacter petrophilus]MRX77234.1 hypothetical protein [Pedobacter petrophilus]
MYSTHLEIFRQIKGIGSASGIFSADEQLYIVGDNSGFLNKYNVDTYELEKIQILFDQTVTENENIPKHLKPDFEVLCHIDNYLYILGSGSTATRSIMVKYDLKTKKVKQESLSKTYEKMRSISSVNADNFNIEGAVFTGTNWLLFNRGNGDEAKNGIFTLSGNDLINAGDIKFNTLLLPNINHVESSFTDATLIGNEIFFISTAENTKSTYHDGEILGSFIGSINAKNLQLNFSYKIPGKHKFEGITLFKQEKKRIEFLLCEDRDTDELNTTIYKLSLTL